MNARSETSEYKLLSRLFFRLLPYQILLIVINAVNGIVDSLYASNAVGKAAMSAIGAYSPINHFLYAASIMLVSGSQILYGRHIGKSRKHIRSVFSVNLAVSAGLSVLTALLMVLAASSGLTGHLVSEEADLLMLNRYIYGQAIGIPALVIGQQLFAFLSLENQTKRTMAASIACFAVNVAADHLLIVVFDLDNLGLGLATALSMWVFLAIQAAYYLAGRSEWKISLRGCRWKDAPEIIRLGYPGAISRFVEMFRCFIVNALILRFVGSAGLSSFAASNSLLAVIWPLPFGMVAVSRMLFSISIGEKDRKTMIDTMRIVVTKGIIIMAIVSAGLVLLAEPLTMLFYRDPSDPVYQMTVMGFRIMPLCMPLSLVSLTFSGYAQTAEKKVFSIILPIVDGALGVTLCSFILIPLLKMNGLYISNILNGVICAAVIFANARLVLKRNPGNLEDLMTIPDDFGAGKDDYMDITVHSIEEVSRISEQVSRFSLDHGVDRRRATIAGLCMEEMTGNVILHGFTKDKKPHSVDIRVVHSGDEVILRIRDDCIPFKPSDRADVIEPKDKIRNCGIRLVYGMAKEVQYQSLLGLNVLTIHI